MANPNVPRVDTDEAARLQARLRAVWNEFERLTPAPTERQRQLHAEHDDLLDRVAVLLHGQHPVP